MSVLINFKICDNAKECGGIEVCPTGALSYDEEKQTIVIDNNKCISCGQCEKNCPIGAIMVAQTDEEYDKLKKEIDEDERTTKDLFVDRYGAAAISEFFMAEADEVKNKINNDNITLIEVYDEDDSQCLLKSIPIKDLTKDMPADTLFYKVNSTEELCNEYGINELPSLLVFEKGNLLGHVEGYYTIDEKEKLLAELNKILGK